MEKKKWDKEEEAKMRKRKTGKEGERKEEKHGGG